MSQTTIDVLTAGDVVARLAQLRSRQPVNYFCFYSSQLGGIVTDPALMVLPFDDHMVHRGHGIFDTAGLVERQDLRPRSAPRSLSAVCRTVEAAGLAVSRRGDARHHRQDDGGQRPARRLDPLLALVGTRAASS